MTPRAPLMAAALLLLLLPVPFTVGGASDPSMLHAGEISPSVASPSSIIRYNVTYYGAGPPRGEDSTMRPPLVHIDGALVVEMVLDESAPPRYHNGIYSDGESYFINVAASRIASVGVSEHTYYFSAFDGTDTGRYPNNGSFYGPTFIPELSFGTVEPSSGDTLTYFTLAVNYADVSGLEPQWVRVSIDGNYHDMTLDDGNPDSIRTGERYIFTSTLDAGQHNFSFAARSNSGAPATGDSGTVHPGPSVDQGELPDLSIAGNGITIDRELLRGGSVVNITARVFNVGKVPVPDSASVNVSAFLGDPDDPFSPGLLIGSSSVPGPYLAPGAFRDVAFHNLTIPANGEYLIYVTVDRDVVRRDGKGTVDEVMDYGSKYSNNKAYMVLRAGPDLEVAAFSPPSASMGSTFNFVIKIANTGTWDALVPLAGIPVEVCYHSSSLLIATVLLNRTSLGVGPGGVIPPGGLVTVWVSAVMAASGEWPLDVRVDTGTGVGALDEINEFDADSDSRADPGTNNRATFTLEVVETGGRSTPSMGLNPIPTTLLILGATMLYWWQRRGTLQHKV